MCVAASVHINHSPIRPHRQRSHMSINSGMFVCKYTQFDITDGDITEVMHHFDKNNNGALEYKELMLLVTGKVVETMEHESKTAHHHSAGDHHTVASTAVHPHHKRIGGGGSFDMIVMSGILKGTDSHVTVRRLRQLGFKGLIIVVTSKSNSEDISEFHECGSNAVILKPLTHQKLMGAFEGACRRYFNRTIKCRICS